MAPPPPPPRKPVPPSSPSPSPKPVSVSPPMDKSVITLEFQRQKAKELQEYFKQKKLEEADQGSFFGFIGKNEISNGRYTQIFALCKTGGYSFGFDIENGCDFLDNNC